MEQKIYKSSFIFSGYSLLTLILFFISFLNPAKATNTHLSTENLRKTKCSIQVNGQSLEEVFNLIQKQTQYNIICVDKSGFLKRKVSINATNSNLGIVLEKISSSVPFTYNEVNKNIIVKPTQISSTVVDRIVRGHIVDSKNQGVPGVSVLIKGSNTGTVTNQDGNFSIKVNDGDILVLSSLGFNKVELSITDLDTYNVQLTDDQQSLSEVVVTALGIKKEKAKLGYAVQEVQGESLIKAREPNIINSLTGRVAGLNIRNSTDLFADPGISLRGRKPLIVIDGIPDQSADLYKVNADDIETLTVLKGAGASALYGSIGQNGAIMITTKRGRGNDLSIDVNSSTQIQPSFIRIPEVQTEYGAGFKGKYTYVDGSGGGPEGSGWIWGPKLDQPAATPSGFFETPQFNSPKDPVSGKLIPLPFISRGKNNVNDFFQTGLISSNNISITQSSEKGSFRASASHI